jgi:uncharacterized protein YbaR (Trm112 family)
MIDKELLEILACPLDKAPVSRIEEGGAEKILCSRCGRKYPVRDDIPVMLEEEAEVPGAGGGAATP